MSVFAVLNVTITLGSGGLQVDCVAAGYPAPVVATLSSTTRGNRISETGTDGPFHFVRRVTHVLSTCNSTTIYTCIGMAGSSQKSVNVKLCGKCVTFCY